MMGSVPVWPTVCSVIMGSDGAEAVGVEVAEQVVKSHDVGVPDFNDGTTRTTDVGDDIAAPT